MKTDWDIMESLIKKLLDERLRAWEYYDYIIIDDSTVLIKVYGDCPEIYYYNNPKCPEKCEGRLMFAIKAQLRGQKLEVIEVF
jgi:hypothetical protein